MRWAWGTRQQLLLAHGLIALRMVLFGAVLFLVLRPWLTAGVTPRVGDPREIVQHAILAAMAVLLAQGMLVGVARTTWRDLGFQRDRVIRQLGWGLVVFVVGCALIAARLAFAGTSPDVMFSTALGYDLGQRVTLAFIGIHVIFGEEVIFRGYLQPGLAARMPAPIAISITALLFAAYHVDFRPAAFIGNVAWGLLWGAARERTGSTIPSATAHFLNWFLFGWL